MSTHTHVQRGKRVFIRLRSGKHIVDQFVERCSSHIVLEDEGRVPIKDVLSMSIMKGLRVPVMPKRMNR